MIKILPYINTFFRFCVLCWSIFLCFAIFFSVSDGSVDFVYVRDYLLEVINPLTGFIFYFSALIATVVFHGTLKQAFLVSILSFGTMIVWELVSSKSEESFGLLIFFGIPFLASWAGAGFGVGLLTRSLHKKYFLNK